MRTCEFKITEEELLEDFFSDKWELVEFDFGIWKLDDNYRLFRLIERIEALEAKVKELEGVKK